VQGSCSSLRRNRLRRTRRRRPKDPRVDPVAVTVVAVKVATTMVEAKDVVVVVMELVWRAGTETITVAARQTIGCESVTANNPKRKKQFIRSKMRSKVFFSQNWRRLTHSLQGIAAMSISPVMALVFGAM
jgi:hypothetical protein